MPFRLNPEVKTLNEKMHRYDRPPPAAASRRHRDHPSFSSSLLDAIYRSIDESDDTTSRPSLPRGAPDRLSSSSFPPPRKPAAPVAENPHRRRTFPSTSSSSDCSSFGGFSSSDAESSIYSLRPVRLSSRSERDRTRPDLPAPSPEKKKTSSIRSRFRELRKSKAPASPGARLASFLNNLFAAAGNPRKTKIGTPSARRDDTTPTSSCLSKTPSTASTTTTAGKRSVRFWPVGIVVGEDCRPCGEKWIYGGGATTSVEEMMRRFEQEEEEEDDDVASDGSSDLFELENLTAIGGFRDELPVYETTNLGTNRAIAYGLL